MKKQKRKIIENLAPEGLLEKRWGKHATCKVTGEWREGEPQSCWRRPKLVQKKRKEFWSSQSSRSSRSSSNNGRGKLPGEHEQDTFFPFASCKRAKMEDKKSFQSVEFAKLKEPCCFKGGLLSFQWNGKSGEGKTQKQLSLAKLLGLNPVLGWYPFSN